MRHLSSNDARPSAYVDTFAYAAPSTAQRRLATFAAGSVLGALVCAVPFASIALPVVPAFLPVISAIAVFGALLTALILGSQYRATQYPPLAFLALAYGAQSLMVLAYLLVFPNLIPGVHLLGSGAQSAAWLYPAWHFMFFACLGAYAISSAKMRFDDSHVARNRRIVALIGASTAVAVAVILFALVRWSDALPIIVLASGQFTFSTTHFLEPALLFVNAGLLIVLVRGTKLRKVVDIWIAVTLVAFFCDILLAGVLGVGRFTVGWYSARFEWCFASIAFPIALVTQMSKIIAGLSTANRSLEVVSDTDSLTSLHNRRSFDARFQKEILLSTREGKPISLLIIDVDEFKLFNDTFGHPEGDTALKAVAGVFGRAISPPRDFAARIGGEEFAIVLPNTSIEGAFTFAEFVRENVAALAIKQHPESVAGRMTVSIGVASSQAPGSGKYADLMARADKALYSAKRAGRNRTHLAGSDRPRALEGTAS